MQNSHWLAVSPASLAVDGLLGTIVADTMIANQCAVTATNPNPWWIVDLEESYVVSYVTALGRSSSYRINIAKVCMKG